MFFRLLTSRFPLASSLLKFKKSFFYKIIKKDSTINTYIKLKTSRLAQETPGFSFFGKSANSRLSSLTLIRAKPLVTAFPSQRLDLFNENSAISKNSNSVFNPIFRQLNIIQTRGDTAEGRIKRQKSLSSLVKLSESLKTFYRYRHMQLASTLECKKNASKKLLIKKLHTLQKFTYALRLQKTQLPSVIRLRKAVHSQRFNTQEEKSFRKQFSSYYRPYRRSVMVRFMNKRRKKIIRRRKIVRLKNIHFFIPSYMQRDLRSLRAIKIQTPSQEEIYHSFRGSLAKVYSFYSSRAF